MVMNANFPADLQDLLGSLSQIENELFENPRKCASGESVTKELEGVIVGHPFNVIPWGIPTAQCHSTLVVGVGYNDDAEKRILEAYEHISAKCPNTKYVIFLAAAWYGLSWKRHSSQFRRVTAILKPFFADPTLLRS
jgi:hypothetical protein